LFGGVPNLKNRRIYWGGSLYDWFWGGDSVQFSRGADGELKLASMLHLFKFCGAGTIWDCSSARLKRRALVGSPLSQIYLQILL